MAEEFDYFCDECDAQVQEDFEFCPSCGTDISDTGEDEPEEKRPRALEGRTRADSSASGRGAESLKKAVEAEQRLLGDTVRLLKQQRRTRAASSASGRGAGPLKKALEAENRRLGRATPVAAGRGAGSSRSGSPTCPECGRRISLSAKLCPNCGRPTHWAGRKWRDSSGVDNSKRMMVYVGILVFLVVCYVVGNIAG